MSAKLRNFLSRWTAPAAIHTYPIDVVDGNNPALPGAVDATGQITIHVEGARLYRGTIANNEG